MTVDTPFVIGSTSKSFTALALMQQVDAGAVDLDVPVQRYVPEFTMADQAAGSITVRQLLHQTSGISSTAGGPIMKSVRAGIAIEAVAELRRERLAGPPGQRFRYSNANFVLAGLVVERASGWPYDIYVQRRIFEPLGMRHSYTSVELAKSAGVADGHRFWFGMPVRSGPTAPSGVMAAGYLVSSAADLGRYLQLYLNEGVTADGVRKISRRGLDTLLAPGPDTTLGPWADGAHVRYAMGWFVGGPWAEPALLHPGNGPGSSAMIVLLPQRGWAVAAVTNATHELPGAPSVIDQLSRNDVDSVLGKELVTTGSLRTFYVVFDLAALLAVALASWDLITAARRLRRGAWPRRTSLRWGGVLARAVAVLVLLYLPDGAGYGWAGAWLWLPDLTVVMAVVAALLTAAAIVRVALIQRPPPGSARGASGWRATPRPMTRFRRKGAVP